VCDFPCSKWTYEVDFIDAAGHLNFVALAELLGTLAPITLVHLQPYCTAPSPDPEVLRRQYYQQHFGINCADQIAVRGVVQV
jgi:hypothetical protein